MQKLAHDLIERIRLLEIREVCRVGNHREARAANGSAHLFRVLWRR
jgi:hypothetical protein